MAEDAFRRALEIAGTQRTKTFELRSAVGLAHLYVQRPRAIPEVLATVLADFDTERDLPEIEEAETLLRRGQMAGRGNW